MDRAYASSAFVAFRIHPDVGHTVVGSAVVIRMQQEPLTPALWDEAMPLLALHWAEIAHYDDIVLEPNVASYLAMAEAGALRVFTARVYDELASPPVADKLVGYALFFVRANLHYASSLQAMQDVVFIHPEYRGGAGYRFIKWCDTQLQAMGVQVVYHHLKAKHNFGAMLERQGYELVDLIYAKRLDR